MRAKIADLLESAAAAEVVISPGVLSVRVRSVSTADMLSVGQPLLIAARPPQQRPAATVRKGGALEKAKAYKAAADLEPVAEMIDALVMASVDAYRQGGGEWFPVRVVRTREEAEAGDEERIPLEDIPFAHRRAIANRATDIAGGGELSKLLATFPRE